MSKGEGEGERERELRVGQAGRAIDGATPFIFVVQHATTSDLPPSVWVAQVLSTAPILFSVESHRLFKI